MSSIFESYDLNKDSAVEKFEAMVGMGFTRKQIQSAFRCTHDEMGEWCRKNYNGCEYDYVYAAIQAQALNEFYGVCQQLGMRGNPSALGIVNEAIRKLGQQQTVKIVFGNDVEEEDESDRNDM